MSNNGYTEQWLADYQARRRGLKIEIVDSPKANKYSAIKTEVDGIVFDSKKEATQYQVLKLRERAGEISGLVLQPKYPLVVNDMTVATYIADFAFFENSKLIVADAKGCKTPVYRIKKKLMRAIYGIEVLEL